MLQLYYYLPICQLRLSVHLSINYICSSTILLCNNQVKARGQHCLDSEFENCYDLHIDSVYFWVTAHVNRISIQKAGVLPSFLDKNKDTVQSPVVLSSFLLLHWECWMLH